MFNALIKDKFTSYNSAIMHTDFLSLGRSAIAFRGNLRAKVFQDTNLENVFLPSFSYYSDVGPFSIRNPAIKLGVFPNECIENLTEDCIQRSINPIHSYIRLTRTRQLDKFDRNFRNDVSFGPNSVFDYFRLLKPLWCCLGPKINDGFTLFHHAECLANVPYRRWVKISKKIIIRDVIVDKDYYYYDRKNGEVNNFENAVNELVSEELILKETYGNSFSYVGDYNEILSYVKNKLIKNPQYLLEC